MLCLYHSPTITFSSHQNQQPLMMKRKRLDQTQTQPTQLGAVVIQQIPAGVTPVAATVLEVTVVMVVVMQQIALGVVPVEVMRPGVTTRIVAEIEETPLVGVIETEVTPITLEVIQQVVCDVQESVSCLLVTTVS